MLEERSTTALLDITAGQIEMGLGRWNRAVRLWEKGLHELKELGDLSDYARSLSYVGRFYLERGDLEQTRKLLGEAETIARRLGGTLLIDTVEGLLRRVDAPGVRPSTSSRTET
jgi:tetratricopeptide (TPR) repeat protein